MHGFQDGPKLARAAEAEDLLGAVQKLVIDFIRAADEDSSTADRRNALVEHHAPAELLSLLDFDLPNEAQGKEGLLQVIRKVLELSVNTWHQGFLDKLYSSITPVGLAADLVLSALNTNAHVYQVAPALIAIEKQTGKALASLFGLTGPYAGGVTQPGGSAANLSSLVIARNNLHPETKEHGHGNKRFVLFTSAHGHYSLEKAAQMLGLGSKAVRSIPVDEKSRMRIDKLDEAIQDALAAGETPFYVNATAGTTVLGSWDSIEGTSAVCKKYGLWLHVDASWGGPVIFSKRHRHKLNETELVDSLALCPHKMLSIPVTCTYLLGRDLRQFQTAMTLPASYLFHQHDDAPSPLQHEVWDLADLTPQCGRRADSLKLALSWVYYGTEGFEAHIDHAYEMASYLTELVEKHEAITLVSERPPACLQVCFFYNVQADPHKNTKVTAALVKGILSEGYMVDYASGAKGAFLRIVVNGQTARKTVEGLLEAIISVGTQLSVE